MTSLKKEFEPFVDKDLYPFLKSWFTGLMEGIEKINHESWPVLLEMTGRACAKVHSDDVFTSSWDTSKGIKEFLAKLSSQIENVKYVEKDSSTISVTYTSCKCPLVNSGLIESPIICNCSPNWIIQNLESVLGEGLEVKTLGTILRGNNECEFEVTY
ncbi:MAG: hypothetical protein ACXABI_07765 [Candidatus Hodarchaeales archaeon]|jgi:hypothetical protein